MTNGSRRFSRDCRLTNAAEFTEVFRSGKRFRDSRLLILARPNGLARARLGMALSRKKIPDAVGRNRLKRLIRESFRKEMERLAGLDIVVLAQCNLRDTDNALIAQSLAGHWSRLEKCRIQSRQ